MSEAGKARAPDLVDLFAVYSAPFSGDPAMIVSMRCMICLLVPLTIATLQSSVLAGNQAVVGFDVPAIVVAQQVDPTLVNAPTVGGKLIRLRIPVSTYIASDFRGHVSEYVVEFESPSQSLRIVDFWPRDEVYSDIQGTVAVEQSRQNGSDFEFKASGAAQPFVSGSASGKFHNKSSLQERYQRKPSMQILTSSGTIRRGYGVFFKFRPGAIPVVEGSREISILAEVPFSWRADILQVSMHAVGRTSETSRATRRLGHSRMWTATHQEGDREAADHTRQFVTQERSLRALAASSQERILDKSLPTIWHKMGAAIDVVDPRIPSDYLARAIFGPQNQYFEGATHRLPIDLRVAILDFWDTRDNVMQLAVASPIAIQPGG